MLPDFRNFLMNLSLHLTQVILEVLAIGRYLLPLSPLVIYNHTLQSVYFKYLPQIHHILCHEFPNYLEIFEFNSLHTQQLNAFCYLCHYLLHGFTMGLTVLVSHRGPQCPRGLRDWTSNHRLSLLYELNSN